MLLHALCDGDTLFMDTSNGNITGANGATPTATDITTTL